MCLEDGTHTTYSSSTSRYAQLSSGNKMMATTLQQQSANMAQQHHVALHQLETIILAAEASQLLQQPHTFSLEDFLRHNPPKFNGKANPNEVDQWGETYNFF